MTWWDFRELWLTRTPHDKETDLKRVKWNCPSASLPFWASFLHAALISFYSGVFWRQCNIATRCHYTDCSSVLTDEKKIVGKLGCRCDGSLHSWKMTSAVHTYPKAHRRSIILAYFCNSACPYWSLKTSPTRTIWLIGSLCFTLWTEDELMLSGQHQFPAPPHSPSLCLH